MVSRRIVIAATGAAIVGGLAAWYILREAPDPPSALANRKAAQTSGTNFYRELPIAQRQQILNDPYELVFSTTGIPTQMKRAFAVMTHQPQFALANPGDPYQSTDVMDNPPLPSRRLVFAGRNVRKCFIYYEHGGIGHRYQILVLAMDDKERVRFLWGGVGFERATDLSQLRDLIAAGKFMDGWQQASW